MNDQQSEALLDVTGAILMLVGLAFIIASLVSTIRAWRNGLPWWSGGMIWFMPSRQPPAARPHMRAALRRFFVGMAFGLGSTLLNILGKPGGSL
ncbi:MAG: hypothetical protein JWO26_1287 [Rhodospirillales bacterium]|jgi:predicted cobalt transporter CbtA|nr:hypothetical protein [Rhodospirillales bacterium]MDB5381655.1 hypothetical protein [Rhodospirillales bacterium]